MMAHIGLSNATNTPELVLDKDECDWLAESTANVMDQFDIKPDPKTEAIVGLIIACGTIYGPRVALVSMKRKQNKNKEKDDNKADVFNANGTYAGETSFQEVDGYTEPATNAGTI